MTATRINLGLASPVRLGRLMLDPPTRTIRHDDGQDEVVEPRVMQVLIALAESRGNIVRREELTERCWDGRVVGEDAINRVLSRLRRVADGIALGSFRLETITKIGYRLVELGQELESEATAPTVPTLDVSRAASSVSQTRRTALLGVAATCCLAVAAGAWWHLQPPDLSQPAREAMERGMSAFRMMSLDQLTTAAAAFHEAARLAPNSAEPWGRLALTYRWLYYVGHGQEAMLNAQRAREAAHKALSIDPGNGDGQATLATLQPLFRNWLAYDAACKPILARHPDEIGIGMLYIDLLSNVGQIRAVNAIAQRMMKQDPGWPTNYTTLVLSNWCLGRLDDADAAMERAFEQWPRSVSLWFIRQRLFAYSGRAAAAIAMVEDVDHRPPGLPNWDFDLSAAESRALLTRSRADIDAAAALFREHSRNSVGVANNAVQFFAAVGRLDDAFAVLSALYFNRGFDVGIRSFAEEQGTYSERRNRPTWLFWLPFMSDLRADPRTAAIVRDVGLSEYWRKAGTGPDFPIYGGKSV